MESPHQTGIASSYLSNFSLLKFDAYKNCWENKLTPFAISIFYRTSPRQQMQSDFASLIVFVWSVEKEVMSSLHYSAAAVGEVVRGPRSSGLIPYDAYKTFFTFSFFCSSITNFWRHIGTTLMTFTDFILIFCSRHRRLPLR